MESGTGVSVPQPKPKVARTSNGHVHDVENPVGDEDPRQDSNCWSVISTAPRWRSWVCFTCALVVSLLFKAACGSIASTINSVLLFFLIVIGVAVFLSAPACIKCTEKKHRNASQTPSTISTPLTSESQAQNSFDNISADEKAMNSPVKTEEMVKTVTNKGRVYFLDTIKTFLTAIVIAHHVVCVFTGVLPSWHGFKPTPQSLFQTVGMAFMTIDQSYFMCLFFFISGYFTPSSLDRQIARSNGTMGYWHFLHSKFKRLGIPLLANLLVLEPAKSFVAQLIVGAPASYELSFGVCWFLAWLLIFNFCYVFIGGHQKVGQRRCSFGCVSSVLL